MRSEEPSVAPKDMLTPETYIANEIRDHEARGMKFTLISAICCAAAIASAYPGFAFPAITYWIGAVREWRDVPSMNPQKE
jgi:hypothetical protein